MATRDIGVFIRDMIRKAPKPFPYIAIFHVLWGILMLLINWGDPIDGFIVDFLWTVIFTVCWFYICDLKRWAANAYIILTLVNIAFFLYVLFTVEPWGSKEKLWGLFLSSLMLPSLLFSILVLVFYRRIDKK